MDNLVPMNMFNFTPSGFVFDLNGTMINDMEYHTRAWHTIINVDLNKELSYEAVKQEMYGKNQEVLERVFGKKRFTKAEMDDLSLDKERKYQEAYRPDMALIPGLDKFLAQAKQQGIGMAIGSAAINFNIDFVLDGLHIRNYFDAIVSADDVVASKPDPETFLKCAEKLGLSPSACIVFEDVPKGVESALNADMKCIVLTTTHDVHEFSAYPNILGFINDYNDPMLKGLFK